MNTRRTHRHYLAIVVLLLLPLYGCDSQPLPPDKLNYEGHWGTSGMELIITGGGGLSYKKIGDSGSKTSVNGPIKKFENDDIVVGVWILTTTFEVQKPPYKENGQWVMVVDGTKLYKKIFKRK